LDDGSVVITASDINGTTSATIPPGGGGTVVTCDTSVPDQTSLLFDGVVACVIPHNGSGGGSTVTCQDNADNVQILIDGVVACEVPKGTNGVSSTIDCVQNPDNSLTITTTDVNGSTVKTVPAPQNGVSPTIDCVQDPVSGNVQLTIADVNGTQTKTIPGGGGGTDVFLQSMDCQVVNPNTQNASLQIVGTLNNGSTVPMSISGSKMWSLISAFAPTSSNQVVCNEITDPQNTCKTYASLQIDGSEACKLKVYDPNKACCICQCVKNVNGEVTFTLTTSSGGYTVDWGDGGPASFAPSGETVSRTYNAFSGKIEICFDDPCATVTNFDYTGLTDANAAVIFGNVCSGCDCD